MDRTQIIEKIIAPTIKKANATMPNFNLNQLDSSVVFYGKENAILDSLNLVSFVFLIEEEIERVTGKKITITTQDVLNLDHPPFESLDNLADFLAQKMIL